MPKVTRYDDDEFAVRLNHNDTIKLLALIMSCQHAPDVPAPHDIFTFEFAQEIFDALELDGDRDDGDYYPRIATASRPSHFVDPVLRLSAPSTETFLNEEEAQA